MIYPRSLCAAFFPLSFLLWTIQPIRCDVHSPDSTGFFPASCHQSERAPTQGTAYFVQTAISMHFVFQPRGLGQRGEHQRSGERQAGHQILTGEKPPWGSLGLSTSGACFSSLCLCHLRSVILCPWASVITNRTGVGFFPGVSPSLPIP